MHLRECKAENARVGANRAIGVNTITLLGLGNCWEIEGGNESSLLLRKRMKPVGMKYNVSFSTG